MLRKILSVCGALMFSLLLNCCKDPLENIELNINSEVLRYTKVFQVEDGNGNPVSNVSARILGRDADVIYNLAGYKDFSVNGGLLGLGVHPDHEPATNRTVEFQIELSGGGYITQVIPVSMNDKLPYSVMTVNMLRTDAPPPGVAREEGSQTLNSGASPADKTISTIAENEAKQTADVIVKTGTRFLDAASGAIAGNDLNMSITYLDPSVETALTVFPGGSLNSNNVIPENTTGATSGAFNPSAVVDVNFFIGNTPVKRFNQPITLNIGLDPTFYNINTNAVLKAGDQLSVYSYETTTAQWKFEKFVTVEMQNGKPFARFESDHLTWFMIGNYVNSCTSASSLRVNANWMISGNTYPLRFEALLAGKVVSEMQASVKADNPVITLQDLPLVSGGLSIRVYTTDGQLLTNIAGEALPAGSCGNVNSITLQPPVYNTSKVTLQLYVRCPGKQSVINILPTFYLYYREAKSSNDPTGFKLLGVVRRGLMSTSLLTVGSKEYDFKAVWGDHTKIVYKKTVTADNSATVGIEPGDIIGEKDGANNLDILRENCP